MSSTPGRAGQARALSQLVAAPLTPAAIFLVVTVNPGPEAETAVRALCADIATLLRAVGFRDLEGRLSCIIGFGSEAWDRLFGAPRPAELHPFREFRAGARHAVATPGDLLFHIRAERMDLCFELASQIMDAARRRRRGRRTKCTAFVFRPARPIGLCRRHRKPGRSGRGRRHACRRRRPGIRRRQLCHRAEISARPRRLERAADRGAGTHHRPHQTDRCRARRRGQAKLCPQRADQDRRGRRRDQNRPRQHAVRRGRQGEFGTYFIGYARSPRTIEQMLENMFVGKPPGNYDRMLDFSRAVTGNLFFAPTATFWRT